MLSENSNTNQAIVETIIWFHRNDSLPLEVPAGVTMTGERNLVVDYGYNNKKYGSLLIKRGQFEVVSVTKNGNLIPLVKYNHSGENKKLQNYVDALKCEDLNTKQSYVSALIILSSESCRSQMVSDAITKLLNEKNNLSNEVWGGLEFAFKNYGSTAKFRGYNIQAGGAPWRWLTVADYTAYIQSDSFKGDEKKEEIYINAVKAYIEN